MTTAASQATDPPSDRARVDEHLVRRAADGLQALMSQADGVAIALLDTDGLLHLILSTGMFKSYPRVVLDPDASLAGDVLRSGKPARSDDTETDPRVDRRITRQLQMRSMLDVPLVHDGEVIGIVILGSVRCKTFDDRDLRLAEAVAGVVTLLVRAAGELTKLTAALASTPARARDLRDASESDIDAVSRFATCLLDPTLAEVIQLHHHIEQAISEAALDIVLQPIVDLASSTLIGVEALSRFCGPPHQSPDRWFADAERVGLGPELELCAMAKALALLEIVPEPLLLSVNVGPVTLTDPRFAALVATSDMRRIVVELTEHVAVENYQSLTAVAARLREQGIRLAVDDAGAGYASFAHIVNLAPEFIKLDRVLIADIDTDPLRHALAGALVGFAHQSGALVVAEGIETAGELDELRRLGVDCGQGFHLARPQLARDLFPGGSNSGSGASQ